MQVFVFLRTNNRVFVVFPAPSSHNSFQDFFFRRVSKIFVLGFLFLLPLAQTTGNRERILYTYMTCFRQGNDTKQSFIALPNVRTVSSYCIPITIKKNHINMTFFFLTVHEIVVVGTVPATTVPSTTGGVVVVVSAVSTAVRATS